MQDGQEYVYQSSATTSAGTMDASPHMSGSNYKMKVRVQVSGKTLNVQVPGSHHTKMHSRRGSKLASQPAVPGLIPSIPEIFSDEKLIEVVEVAQ